MGRRQRVCCTWTAHPSDRSAASSNSWRARSWTVFLLGKRAANTAKTVGNLLVDSGRSNGLHQTQPLRRAALTTAAAPLKGLNWAARECALQVYNASIQSERGPFKYMACEILAGVLACEASCQYRKHRRQCVARQWPEQLIETNPAFAPRRSNNVRRAAQGPELEGERSVRCKWTTHPSNRSATSSNTSLGRSWTIFFFGVACGQDRKCRPQQLVFSLRVTSPSSRPITYTQGFLKWLPKTIDYYLLPNT